MRLALNTSMHIVESSKLALFAILSLCDLINEHRSSLRTVRFCLLFHWLYPIVYLLFPGRFLASMLEIVMRWHKDKKTYEKVCCISML